MSLRRFLNVAYAVLVDEFQRSGADLQSALERVSNIAEGAAQSVSPQAPTVAPAQNEESLAALTSMMQAMQNNPLRKKRKPRKA
jgi:hypothetical protein